MDARLEARVSSASIEGKEHDSTTRSACPHRSLRRLLHLVAAPSSSIRRSLPSDPSRPLGFAR